MRQIITEKDIKKLIGTWVVQLDTNESSLEEVNFANNPGFWLEKRISFVGTIYGVDGWPHIDPEKDPLIILNGVYYTKGIYNYSQFVKWWNDYIFTIGMGDRERVEEGSKGQRYYRQLTDSELDWLTEELKKKKNK